ncbi:MAG: class I SAM-dependent methyltransferase [Pseudomonadota bacterium]
MDFAAFEKAGWADPDVAQSYADGFAFASDQVGPTLIRAVAARRGMRAVDICSGHGSVAAGLAEAGLEVTGVDFSPAMLAIARDRVPGVTFLEGDAMALPFEDGCFDAATMGFGILHVPDAQIAVSEAARVLKPGARFAYSCWCGPEVLSALPAVFGAIQAHGDMSIDLPASKPAYHFAQAENAIPLMERAGFVDVGLERVDSYWLCKAGDDPLRFFAEGTVRGAGLLRAQPADNFKAIRRAVMAWVERNGRLDPDSEAFRVPIPAVVVSGRRAKD